MYEFDKIQFALEAFKEKLEEDKTKWSALWESLEENPSFEEVYDITKRATFLAKSEKEEIDRLESHLVSLQSYHKKLQTKHSEVSRYRGELQEQYENLKNEWGTDIAKLHAETSDTADGFSNEILVDEEETVPARKSIAFTVDLNPPVVQPVNKEVSLQSSQSSVKTKSFLDGGNTTVDASVAAADVSAGLIDKSGDSFLEQNNELSAEGDSMLSNTFLNEMEELKSNLALDSSQNSMNAQQSSVCYNSSKEPLRVDPETPQATEPVEAENEKPSCEVKKKSSSLISKFIKKSRSLSRSRKDKKKKPP